MLTRTWWVVVGLLVVVLGLLQISKPEPTSWKRTFSSTSTQPYGTWIALHVLDSITDGRVTMVDSASDVAIRSAPARGQWWIVAPRFQAADEEVDSLFAYARRGGHVVIATRWINDTTEKRLGVDLRQPFMWDEDTLSVYDSGSVVKRFLIVEDFISYQFKLRADSTALGSDLVQWDTLMALENADQSADQPRFVLAARRALGLGSITVLSSPELMSNLAFVHDTASAVARYLMPVIARTDGPIMWDRYHNGSLQLPTVGDLLSQSHAAQLALVLVVVSGLMYVGTNARRRQRAIPILEPVRNTTSEFVRTVADLMQSSHDPAYVMRQRIVHLRRFCASVLHVPLVNIDSTTERRLIAATGCEAQLIHDVLDLVRRYGDVDGVEQQWTDAEWSATDLLRRSAIIDTFYEKASR